MPKKTEEKPETITYQPSVAVQKVTQDVYSDLGEMIQVMTNTYPQFNDRTLKQFIDDGDKRLNAFTPSKEAYDPPKEAWQSNVAMTTVKDRQMKTLAGFSLSTPDFESRVFGEDDIPDIDRAELAKWLIIGSYQQEENITIQNFWQSWECARAGTVVVYEGYLKSRLKQKFIKSYDIVTGKIEVDEREVDVDDQCISHIVPLTEFYIWNAFIHDVQDQPKVAWVRYVDKTIAQREFGKYANWKYVKTKSQVSDADPDSFYYKSKWEQRVKNNNYEIVRMYDKTDDSYRIVVNGVLMLDAPLIWISNGHKVYPFAKSGWLPFTGKDFFWMQSFPDHMRGMYDQENTTWNTATDKQWRGMTPYLAVGRVNTDQMNLEDEMVMGMTKVTLEDVSQVKQLQVGGLETADVQMLNLIANRLDEMAPSLPGMLQNKNATAREVVIANENMQEQKSIYSEMMVDLWRQKYQLRLANIQQNYPQPRIIYEGGKTRTVFRTYTIQNAVIDRTTNEIGTLAVQFRDVTKEEINKLSNDIDEEEEMMKQDGISYRKLIVPVNYLDHTRTQVEMIPASIFKQSLGYRQATVMEKLDMVNKFFPEYFVANQSDFFAQMMSVYDDSPAKYERNMQQLQQAMNDQRAAEMVSKGGGAPAEGTPTEGAPAENASVEEAPA